MRRVEYGNVESCGLVPGRSHYAAQYLADGRVFSYAHQIHTVLQGSPRRVLEVGIGAGVVAAALRLAGIDVKTLDLQPELAPDVVASVLKIPFEQKSFDYSVCCQVLEHLPFDAFEQALRELRYVTRLGLVLSLPDVTRYNYVSIRVPRLGRREWAIHSRLFLRLPNPDDRLRGMGHYWEIGFEGFPLSRIKRAAIRAGWSIARTWRVPEHHWHRFFHLLPMPQQDV
jgi:hypothetical protein